MRLIDADELMEHVWRDKLDSREAIAKMINDAQTVKDIPTKIPIDIFEQMISKKKVGYEAGLKDAWECIRKLDDIPSDDLVTIFMSDDIVWIVKSYSTSEVMYGVKMYETKSWNYLKSKAESEK